MLLLLRQKRRSCKKLLHRILPEQQAHESIRQTPENRSTSIGKCGVPRKRWLHVD